MAAVMDGGSVARLLAQGVGGTDPQGWWDVLRHDVIPVAAAYVVFLGLLMTYRVAIRRPSSGAPPRRAGRPGADPSWGDLIRQLAGTAAGGYAFFLSIVVVFYFILGGEDLEFIRQALVEGSLLTFALVLPAFLLFSVLADRRSRGRPTKH
ncbi:MAG TPA: DUF6256 family protein [Actinomycetota bacterium]|nr:DUF6256 family protein [Actinomycetota bacterium]